MILTNFPLAKIGAKQSLGRNGRDFFDAVSANELAANINRYWAELGFEAEAHIVLMPNGQPGKPPRYVVRSNCVNGVPTKRCMGVAA